MTEPADPLHGVDPLSQEADLQSIGASGPRRTRRRGRPPVIEQTQVAAAALRIVKDAGLDGLTLRRLADALKVSPAALYGHVSSKDALVDLVIDELLAGIDLPVDINPRRGLELAAVTIKETMQAHGGLSQAILQRGAAGPHGVALAEAMLSMLRDAGVDDEQLWDSYHILLVYLHGTVLATTWPRSPVARQRADAARAQLAAQPPESIPIITAASRNWRNDPQHRFLSGLRALLDGLSAPTPDPASIPTDKQRV